MLRPALSRRDLLKLGLVGTGYIVIRADGSLSHAEGFTIPPSPFTTPFVDELPFPGIAREVSGSELDAWFDTLPTEYKTFWVNRDTTKFFKIASEKRSVQFHSQLPPTEIWGYRDLSQLAEKTIGAGTRDPLQYNILGPTFKQLFGDLGPPRNLNFACPKDASAAQVPVGGGFIVRHVNHLPKDHKGFGVPRTTVHLHGGHHLARADGFPENIENRPATSPATPDGFPCFVVMEPPLFVAPPDEPVCDKPTPPTPPINDATPDGRPVTERQCCDYYYPVLDPGVLDLIRCSDKVPVPSDPTERPSTQWYHDHVLDFTGPNVMRGLTGFVLCFDELDSNDEDDGVDDPDSKALRLPSGKYDIPLALQDKRFDQAGRLVFSTFDHDGFLGDKFLVNGAIQPFLQVERRKYRFRFLDGSNARIYRLFINDGKPFGKTFPMDLIATEGGLLSRPLRGTISLLLSMAERLEVVFDFAAAAPFNPDPNIVKNDPDQLVELFLENRLPQSNGRKPDDGLLPQGGGNQLLKFKVVGPPQPNNSRVPDVLRWFPAIRQEEINRAVRRSFRFERGNGAWQINGRFVNLERPMAISKRGQPEIWHLENSSGGWWHPIHIHSEFFRVLKRNGRTPTDTARNPVVAERDGLAKRDTILLKGGDSVDVFLKFRDHLGPFVFHCHNIEHEDMAMMARFDVVP